MNNFDYLFRFIIVGDSNVGKSCLLLQFTDQAFRGHHETTIGVEFGSKTIAHKNKKIKIQIWDTVLLFPYLITNDKKAGQESFKSITRSYYRGAIGGLVVYDITNRESFENVERWIEEIQSYANEKIVLCIVGNKADMKESRKVSVEEGQNLARKRDLMFYETSAKTGENVEQAFLFTSLDIITRLEEGRLVPTEEQGIKVSINKNKKGGDQEDEGETQSSQGGCCS